VNLSARQFNEPNLVASIAEVLAATGLAPACLELELTESLFMHDVALAVSQLHDMKALGVRCRSTISAPAIPARLPAHLPHRRAEDRPQFRRRRGATRTMRPSSFPSSRWRTT
jgi:hypothetical protein